MGTLTDDDHQRAWARKYAREPAPWRGPADLAPLLALADAALPGHARVLETGAGGGKTVAALPREWDIVPVDWVRGGFNTSVGLVADVRSLPFRARTFDIALLVFVLGHLDAGGRLAASREVARVLKPGGFAFVRAFEHGDLRATSGRALDEANAYEREGLRHSTLSEADVRELFPSLACAGARLNDVPTRFAGPRRFVDAAFRAPRDEQ